MADKETAYKTISELVERFSDQYDSYKKADYNETLTRRDFIDPFFKALGWDVDNSEGYAESYREVIHEDKIKVKGATKAPDYAFRLVGGKKLFFVEAKKPSVAVKDEIPPAYQIRRYGWSAKLPISIITDFEEFAVYDCTKKPYPSDKASVARIKYLTFRDYLREFDFIWETFSKEKVLKGGLDKFVQSDTHKKGTATVDKEFLESLDNWRKYLATSIAINNKQLDEDEINFVVQQTIDRIIFLRIAEDRRVEPYGSLKEAIRHGNYYENLFEQFRKADEKYNSGLFDLKKDKISEHLKIDNKVIKTIITELYYPESPYEFSVLSVEILGSAYEQFLGKVIRITPAHHAKIEEKPEVRKAGGVYYTPQYVVDYIVKNTVGKLIENKTPKEVSKIKIVDPACGSGSFLIGAYDYLLRWHLEYYYKHPAEAKKAKALTPSPSGRVGEGLGNLTTAEKKRILLNNIFGVDIDVNAVEVTKLSLLLKCMEGETEASINHQLKMFHERILPDLDNNIKCGNSLIDTDYYASELDFGDEKKIKPFNWQKEFSEVFKQGGFDCVIGNPPWVSLSGKFGNQILSEHALNYLIAKFHGNTYRPNLYEYFVHKGLEIIKEGGYFSFIVPDRLGFNEQFIPLRKKILKNYIIEELLYKAEFPNIITDTLIFRIHNMKKKSYQIKVGEFGKELQIKKSDDYLKDTEYKFSYESSDVVEKVLNKIFNTKNCRPLGNKLGIIESKTGVILDSSYVTEKKSNQKQIKIIKGRNVERFYLNGCYYCEFSSKTIKGGTNDEKKLGAKEKVLLRKTGYPLFATYDDSKVYPEQSLYFLFNNKTNLSLKYLTAIINSNLFQFVYWHRLVTNRDSTPQLKKVDLDRFPVFILDLSKKEEKSLHDEIVKLVDQLLKLNEEIREQKLETKRNLIQRKIDYCENQINEIVYQLYGLTEDEIKIVEGK
jgi:hypothetical protein